jgi:hypothetical protein
LIQINALARRLALTASWMLAWFVSVMIVNFVLAAANGANCGRTGERSPVLGAD